MTLQLHVIEAPWQEYMQALREIRRIVFIEEQEVPQELEWDGQDEPSTHFLAVNEIGQYIGCARLLPSGQIGRMAVLPDYRGSGVGAELLTAAVDAGQALGLARLFLHAQSYAENFYRKGGFLPYGDEFLEAGIAHVSMEMKLAVPFTGADETPTTGPKIRAQAVRDTLLDTEPQVTTFNGFHDGSDALHRVIHSASRRLLILSPYLDHDLFDTNAMVDAISALARSAPRVQIKILIFNSKLIVQRGHKIVELARRLDQKVSIRMLTERPNNQSSSFVCADLDAYWLLPSFDNYDGVSDLANPVTCRRLTEVFDTAWEKSIEDTELRTLRI